MGNILTAPAGRGVVRAAVLAGAMAFGGGLAEAATLGFDGQQIRVGEFLGDPGFPPTAEEFVTVGDDVELENFGAEDGGFFSFDIDIGATGIELLSNQEILAAPGIFGFVFTDAADAIMRILTAEITSAIGYTGITSDAVSVVDGGNGLVVNFENVGIAAGALLQIDVTFAEKPGGVIPLPATLPLALVGFAAFAGLRLRRR